MCVRVAERRNAEKVVKEEEEEKTRKKNVQKNLLNIPYLLI